MSAKLKSNSQLHNKKSRITFTWTISSIEHSSNIFTAYPVISS